MDYPQFNSLFGGALEDDNDSVMDRVVDHINFGGYEGTSNANIDDETCNNENIGGATTTRTLTTHPTPMTPTIPTPMMVKISYTSHVIGKN